MRIQAPEIDTTSVDGLREKTVAQLKEDLTTLRKTGVDQKFQKVFGTLEDVTKPRRTKKNVARVLTVLREKQIQNFLLNDSEVGGLLDSGKVYLSAGKNDPKSAISKSDINGTDGRSITLSLRLWSHLRKNPTFFERTRHIPRV